MTARRRPWIGRVLVRLAPPDVRHDFAAELDAAWAEDTVGRGAAARRLWYWQQAMRGAAPLLKLRGRRMLARAGANMAVPHLLTAARQDVQYALRQAARSPGFFLGAVLTLGLGIGANLAVLTVAWQAVLKPLPYPDGDRLVRLWETFPNGSRNPVMPANFRDWQREAASLETIAAYTYFRGTSDLSGGGEPEQWEIRHVTADYFRVFGMAPLVGRTLGALDERAGPTATVISEGVWRRRFAADPDIAGREIRLAGRSAVVVGVMPKAFEIAAGRVDAWSMLVLPPEVPGQRLAAHYLGVVGRLKRGIEVDQAAAELKGIGDRAAVRFPVENGNLSATLESIQGTRGASMREQLTVLGAAAGAVLLAACANLASLQLARGLTRRRELAVRAALGASRFRLWSQLVTESLVLALAGGLAGLVFGRWVMTALGAVAPDAVRVAAGAGFDRTVVLAALGLSLAAGALLAGLPAWRASRGASTGLRQRATSIDRGGMLARKVLLVTQIGLAVVLTVIAALLGASLIHVIRVEPGFRTEGVAAFDLSLPAARFESFGQRHAAVTAIASSVATVPGVTGVCAINEIPFDGNNAAATMTYVPEGQGGVVSASPRNITAGCLDVLGLPLRRGRAFAPSESARVAIVTESFAARAWPNENPIGRRVHLGVKSGDLIEIVGVIGDSKVTSLEARPFPQLYEFASERSAFWPARMIVRTAGPPEPLFSAIREVVRRADADQPVARLRALKTMVAESTNGRRFAAGLVAGFAGLALTLTILGTFGLMAQIVGQRRLEFGIRLALGATPGRLVGGVMRHAWVLVAVGGVLGAGGAVLAARAIRGLVFGVSAADLRVVAGVTVALAVAALLAAWIPARRAARIDPLAALQSD